MSRLALFRVVAFSFALQFQLFPAGQINVLAGPEADESLFLLYLLPNCYAQFLSNQSAPKEQDGRDGIVEVKALAQRVIQRGDDSSQDKRVTRLYSDFLTMVDAFEKSKQDLQQRLGTLRKQSVWQNFKSGVLSGVTVGAAYYKLKELNQDTPGQDSSNAATAAGVALATTAMDMVWEGYKSISAADEAEKAAISAQHAYLDRLVSEIDARSKNTTEAIVSERGWKDVEINSADSDQRTRRYQQAIGENDLETARAITQSVASANPRSFFALTAQEHLFLARTNLTTTEVAGSAHRIVGACRLIPSAPIYDEFRLRALLFAAGTCVEFVAGETRTAGKPLPANELSSFTVSLWEEICRRAPASSRDICRILLATALLLDSRVTEAEAQAIPLEGALGTLPAYQYLVACISARKGDNAAALNRLNRALRCGLAVTRDVWTDPEFTLLRSERTSEFEELFRVKASWTIEYGLLNDDVILRSQTPFDLSNVRIKVTSVALGKRYGVELTAASIPSGQAFRWRNALSIPRDPAITGELTLECEQSPRIVTAEFQIPPP